MNSQAGSGQPGTHAKVPHPIGVRDLKRERMDLAAELTRQGAPGSERRARVNGLVLDRLAEHWDAAVADALAAGEIKSADGLALGAVGSVGRKDAGPLSDLDLVLLHDGNSRGASQIAPLAQRLWYPIWDAGLELDYSMRSISECRQVASKDLAAAAGLLDLHCVAGDQAVAHQARSAILSDWRSAARQRLPELLAASRSRADVSGELAYLIEPNLKEARGGLRDVVSLTALAATWLTDRPHGAIDDAHTHLLDVRDAIHLVGGRPHTRLERGIAGEVAEMCGYDDADALLQSLAEAGRTVAYALDTTEQGARRALETSGRGSRAFFAKRAGRAPRNIVVNEGIIDVDGVLHLDVGVVPAQDAMLPLRAAAAGSATGLPLSLKLIEALTEAPALPEPWPTEALSYFMQFLKGGENVLPVWEAIDLAGLMVTWIPEWEGVRNRPQRSPVHRFTVDRHMIETVVVASKLRRTVERPELLLLSSLFHDIGKRPGATDHSIDGAALIPQIAARMGLDDALAHDIELLVREHLTLPDLATTEDISEPATVERLLAAMEGRLDVVNTARALAEADAIAAGPKAWSKQRHLLIDRLTAAARIALEERAHSQQPDAAS